MSGRPPTTHTAGDAIWATFAELGADCVFGLPGSQTAGLFQALGGSRLRTIVPTHELAAAFMANGYARASGRPGLVSTIPGPGFTYALTGLAEARLDSTPLVLIVPAAAEPADREHLLQAIDQRGMAASLVKRIVSLDHADAAPSAAAEAWRTATAGEPGPVMLELAPGVALASCRSTAALANSSTHESPAAASEPASGIDQLATRVEQARRIVLYLGAGALDAAASVHDLVDRTGAAVVTTTTARGVLPEDHPALVVRDPGVGQPDALNALIDRADLVVALGCKFSHNGAAGFAVRIDPARLVTVNASGPSRNYPASLHLTADVRHVVDPVVARLAGRRAPGGDWDSAELDRLRQQSRAPGRDSLPEPCVAGSGLPVADLIHDLERALPADAIVVTDSGLHQMSVRRHFRVRSPRGLIVPTNFQSMGFALPAAIGAALAAPGRRVVAVIGDGGLMMSALELATAARERIDLTVVLFNDGAYGLIRQSQLAEYGTAHGSDLVNPDFAPLVSALGAEHRTCDAGGIAAALEGGRTEGEPRVVVVEVSLSDAPAMRRIHTLGTMRRVARRWLPNPPKIRRWLGR